MLHVALYQPVIPQNTGNIARQCVGMEAHLHLVGPLGFEVTDKTVKRAGLDYWEHLTLTQHDTPEDFFDWLGDRQPWLITKFGKHRFDQAPYRDGDVLLFGAEKNGLPQEVHDRFPGRGIYIPVLGKVRSYNLGNAVAAVLGLATCKAGLADGKHNFLPERESH